MEFQAIILAGGKGSRMNELTSNTPKCLLPIGNKPMIWYPVRMFEAAGFKDINIITLESIKSRVETELKKSFSHGLNFNLSFYGIDDTRGDEYDDDEFGTANSLKLLKDKIVSDCMIVSCDLIASINIQSMANFYRVNNASFVALLADVIEQNSELPVPGSKGKFAPERDIIALDTNTNRILYFNSQDDIDEIKLKFSVFQAYPKLVWTSKLQDGHFYIIKKCLIDYIIDNKKIFSLKSDFLPLICKKQFSSHRKLLNNTNQRQTVIDYLRREAEGMSHQSSSKHSNDLLSCYAFILADGFCYRANNLAIYAEVNRQIVANNNKIMPHYQREKHDSINKMEKIPAENIIGEGTEFGEKCVIKKSVLGKGCKIGDKVKITNSILMDNVVLEEGVVIQGSIVCSNSKIFQKSEFKDCLVGYKQVILTGKYSNETIQDVENLIDD